ncbi:MAG: hypothetical protein F4128_03195 [Gammaproteobacteria bacterium]|nr:hypothetical protein [Gammaproteobacteria bacterium]
MRPLARKSKSRALRERPWAQISTRGFSGSPHSVHRRTWRAPSGVPDSTDPTTGSGSGAVFMAFFRFFLLQCKIIVALHNQMRYAAPHNVCSGIHFYPKNFSLLPFSGDSIMAKAIENRQLEAALAPVVAFNKLVLRNAEKAFNMQITSLQAYAKVNLDNINAGLEVRNVDDFKVYAEKQKDVAKEITAQISADVKAFGELNANFLEDTRTLTESNIKAAAETAKAA